MTRREIRKSFADLVVLPGFGASDLGILWSLGF
jgi:hypothetical protein